MILKLPIAFGLLPWASLAGGFTAGLLTIGLARSSRDPLRLILVGAAIAALLNALVVALISLGTQSEVGLLYQYLLGSLANRSWPAFWLLAPWLAVALPLALLAAPLLNLLRLGDDTATGLGLPVLPTRLGLMLLATALVAAVVAVCGQIGWIALLAPHSARRILGRSDARQVLPLAMGLGSLLLASADLAARLALAPIELPVGLWTTLLGGPLLLFLLKQARRL